jgi:BolA protein
MKIIDVIRQKLENALNPSLLEVTDDSARHLGHPGHDPRGESHFVVHVVSDRFRGLSRPERHRVVYEILSKEISERIHALSIKALAPGE